jgi:Tfp pilus assembly protein PilO
MDRNRLWILGAVLVIGATAVLGWLLGISPKLGEARAADIERVSVEAQNSAYRTQLETLKAQFESIGELRTELATLRQAVPSEADLPEFLRQLDDIGRAHSVTFSSIQVSDAKPYAPILPSEPVATAEAPARGATDAVALAAASPPAAADTPAVTSRVTAANFVAIPVSLTVDGGYDNVLAFIKGVQDGSRLMLVTAFNTNAAPDGDGAVSSAATASTAADTTGFHAATVTGTISGFVYVLLNSGEGAAAG